MLQAEYYVVERENNDHYPLFSWDQKSGDFGLGKPVHHEGILEFRLGEPIPKKIEWADFHRAPQPVVSLALATALEKLDIYGIQLIPAKVRNPKDPFSEPLDYIFMHVWNRIACLDKTESAIEYLDEDDPESMIFSIDKFVMNESVLEKIELPKRLMFELAEKTSILIVHQSVKDAIESINAKGIRFVPALEWNSDSAFD
ncbi:MAG: imm11 family protein [Cellvibrio sp.]